MSEGMTLLPCPFCGGHVVDRLKIVGRCIECQGCGASGPEVPKEADRNALIRAWNRRTQTAQAVDVGAVSEALIVIDGHIHDDDTMTVRTLRTVSAILTVALSGEKAGR